MRKITFIYFFSCTNNARFQIHPDRRIVVTALQDIPKGMVIHKPCGHIGGGGKGGRGLPKCPMSIVLKADSYYKSSRNILT